MFCRAPRGGGQTPLGGWLRVFGRRICFPPPMARLVALLALIAAVGLAACGDDDDGDGGGGETPPPPSAQEQTETEPTPSEQREALEDTTVKPEIPRPSGSPPRRLQTDDIVRGKGPAAKPGDTVLVHYAGVTFSTGEEFDASWNRGEPFPFPLGGGQVIEGWDRGIVGMKVGGRRMLTIPPELAYGAQGFPPAIGPNETLVFVVDLLEVR
jgi:peptidylprolyl isomerase